MLPMRKTNSSALPGLCASPGDAIHLGQKTCGLFDTGLSNDDDLMLSLPLDDIKPDLLTIDSSELFSGAIDSLNTPELASFYEEPTDLSLFWPLAEPGEENKEIVEVEEVIELRAPTTKPVKSKIKLGNPPKAKKQGNKRGHGFDLITLTNDHDYSAKKPKMETAILTQHSDDDSVDQTDMKPPILTPQQKYVERRQKNNEASKVSRANRKQKYRDLEDEAEKLRVENDFLAKRAIELEALAKIMKEMLVKKMSPVK